MTGPGMARTLKQVADDDYIKGVILRVDSPGGDAIASAEILHAAENAEQEETAASFRCRTTRRRAAT